MKKIILFGLSSFVFALDIGAVVGLSTYGDTYGAGLSQIVSLGHDSPIKAELSAAVSYAPYAKKIDIFNFLYIEDAVIRKDIAAKFVIDASSTESILVGRSLHRTEYDNTVVNDRGFSIGYRYAYAPNKSYQTNIGYIGYDLYVSFSAHQACF